MRLPKELAVVPGEDEELDRITQGVQRAGETARPTREAGEVMPELGVVALNRVGLAFVGQRRVLPGIVDQVRVGRQLIRVVLPGGRRMVEQRLEPRGLAVSGDIVGNDAAGGAVYLGDEVDPLFFCPSNV
jgi:hypothetical protein